MNDVLLGLLVAIVGAGLMVVAGTVLVDSYAGPGVMIVGGLLAGTGILTVWYAS